MGHLLSLALLALDCVVRAWRIQLAAGTAGGRLSFQGAFRLNLYGEAASQLTPNRLGGEPARFLGLAEAGLRPVTGIVAIALQSLVDFSLQIPAITATYALIMGAAVIQSWPRRALPAENYRSAATRSNSA